MRDPELEALMSAAILHRNLSDPGEEYQAMERVIDALSQHPYFVAKGRNDEP
ncbi:MAG: hypothetical protein AAFY43_01675 [Pseudomonadota bacterium]